MRRNSVRSFFVRQAALCAAAARLDLQNPNSLFYSIRTCARPLAAAISAASDCNFIETMEYILNDFYRKYYGISEEMLYFMQVYIFVMKIVRIL